MPLEHDNDLKIQYMYGEKKMFTVTSRDVAIKSLARTGWVCINFIFTAPKKSLSTTLIIFSLMFRPR